MHGVKGFSVCDRYHFAGDSHSGDEIIISIDKLNWVHPSVLFGIEDLFAIYTMMHVDYKEDAGETSELVQWAEDAYTYDKDIALLTSEEE